MGLRTPGTDAGGGPDLDHGIESKLAGVLNALADRVDRPVGNSCIVQLVEPVPRRLRPEPLDEQRPQLLPVCGPVGVLGEPRVVSDLWQPQDAAKLAELCVVARGDDQLIIGGGERLVREEARVGVAHPVRDNPPAT